LIFDQFYFSKVSEAFSREGIEFAMFLGYVIQIRPVFPEQKQWLCCLYVVLALTVSILEKVQTTG